MMFLEYFVWGTWYVTMGTYLSKGLGFGDVQIGAAYGTVAVAAMISPFFVGMVADRFFATEKVMAVLHLLGGLLLLGAASVRDFPVFYLLLQGYTLCYMPTIALSNSLTFSQLRDPGKEFPAIRVLGTIGWIAAGLIIGTLKLEDNAAMFYLAAGVSLALGMYSLTLPHVPPKAKGQKSTVAEILGLDALAMLKDPSFLVFFTASLLICIPLTFYYNFTNLFLNEVGMVNAAGKMTLGQASELFFLLVMPWFFRRLGIKKMMMAGMFCWAARYVLFAFGDNGPGLWMLYGGILLHGICYDFFFVTGQIYTDKRAGEKFKGAAQGLITFATYGLGMFIGSYVSGWVVDLYKVEGGSPPHDWAQIWLIPAIAAGVVLLLFTAVFREPKSVPEKN